MLLSLIILLLRLGLLDRLLLGHRRQITLIISNSDVCSLERWDIALELGLLLTKARGHLVLKWLPLLRHHGIFLSSFRFFVHHLHLLVHIVMLLMHLLKVLKDVRLLLWLFNSGGLQNGLSKGGLRLL